MVMPLDALDPSDRREVERRIDQHLHRVRLLTLALMASLTLVGGGAAWVTVSGFVGAPLGGLPRAATWAVALYVAASIVGASLLTRKLLSGASEGSGAETVLERHFGAVVVGMALREGSGIFGAIWGALIGSLQWVIVLALPPLLAMIVARPRRRELVEQLRGSPPEGGEAPGA